MTRVPFAKYKRLRAHQQWVEPTADEALQVADWDGAIWWLNHLKDVQERLSAWYAEYINDGGYTGIEAYRRGNHVFNQVVKALRENKNQYDFVIQCIEHIKEERDKKMSNRKKAI